MMKFELYKEQNEEYFFRMMDNDEEILSSLNGHKEKTAAIDTIESVKKNVPIPSGIKKKDSSADGYFFEVFDAMGKAICRSAMFYSAHLRDKWLNDVQKEVPQLSVIEIS